MKTRVLVVEDDPKVLSALRRGLALEGYEVDAAEDGQSALKLAAAAGIVPGVWSLIGRR